MCFVHPRGATPNASPSPETAGCTGFILETECCPVALFLIDPSAVYTFPYPAAYGVAHGRGGWWVHTVEQSMRIRSRCASLASAAPTPTAGRRRLSISTGYRRCPPGVWTVGSRDPCRANTPGWRCWPPTRSADTERSAPPTGTRAPPTPPEASMQVGAHALQGLVLPAVRRPAQTRGARHQGEGPAPLPLGFAGSGQSGPGFGGCALLSCPVSGTEARVPSKSYPNLWGVACSSWGSRDGGQGRQTQPHGQHVIHYGRWQHTSGKLETPSGSGSDSSDTEEIVHPRPCRCRMRDQCAL